MTTTEGLTRAIRDERVEAAAVAITTAMGSGDWKLCVKEARAALRAANEVADRP